MDGNVVTNLHLALAYGVLSSIEENWHKSKEDRLTSSQQGEALTIIGRSAECSPSGSQSHSRS
ncbi:hypothetical protein PanWU01x14_299880, partial [Parasponia andersonii]